MCGGERMYNLILGICEHLDMILNASIIILFLVEFVFALISGVNLHKLKNEINALNNPKIKKGRPSRKKRGEFETPRDNSISKWSDLEEFLKEYQDKMKIYTAFSLVIPLFTLLGILGTVAGLFVSMQDMEAAENMYEGIRFALSSTVLGIICAVIYKVVDIIFSSLYISHIDEGIELFEKNFNVTSSDSFHALVEDLKQLIQKE